MIQATVSRFVDAGESVEFLSPVIIGNARHEAVIRDQLADIGITPSAVVLEPVGRNTAATALLAAEAGAAIDPEALVLLLPADHRIARPDAFIAAIERAAPTARDRIVTFGIQPTGPETGFGYIERGEDLADGVHAIARFREKPNRETAEALIADGRHFWNAGIFFFSPQTVQAEFRHAPAIRDAAHLAWTSADRSADRILLPHDAFAAVPSEPFDIAIMEKTDRSAVAPCDIGWADVGSWAEILRMGAANAEGVVATGPAAAMDAPGSLVYAEGVPVAVCGVANVIVVATEQGVLVIDKERAQDVKPMLAKLREAKAID